MECIKKKSKKKLSLVAQQLPISRTFSLPLSKPSISIRNCVFSRLLDSCSPSPHCNYHQYIYQVLKKTGSVQELMKTVENHLRKDFRKQKLIFEEKYITNVIPVYIGIFIHNLVTKMFNEARF